jgi:hypothetical protein
MFTLRSPACSSPSSPPAPRTARSPPGESTTFPCGSSFAAFARCARAEVASNTIPISSNPEDLSVVVASNLNADILSDLGSALAGILGLAASANYNPERRFPSMFEPVHCQLIASSC